MQISSANSGSYSSPGLSPAVLPTARKPDAGSTSNATVEIAAASDARSLQRIASPATPTNSEASRALVLARQRASFDSLPGITQAGQPSREVAAQRAVAEYNIVAAQEERYELGDVLAGIDVFA